jgi:predicted aldo/keto reductase-like oxidoreductase
MENFENITIIIEEDTELHNQPYDYSSPINEDMRETFSEPFMTSTTQTPNCNKNTFIPSVLSKRKFEDAFDIETFDDERYSQHISNDYFDKSHGHDVYYTPIYKNVVNSIHFVDELLEWCDKYLASKKK